MPYLPKPDGEKHKAFGVSFDEITVSRLEALLGIRPGKRSEVFRDLIVDSMRRNYGHDWEVRADVLRENKAA